MRTSDGATVEVVGRHDRDMHASRHARRVTGRSLTGAFGALRQAAQGLDRRVRASEYITVGASARFKAAQRSRTRTASRLGFLIIGGAAIFDGIVVFDPHLKGS